MLKILIKNAVYNTIGFYIILVILRLATKGSVQWLTAFYESIAFGFLMALFLGLYLRYQLRKRSMEKITDEEVELLLSNTIIEALSLEEIRERLQSSELKHELSVQETKDGFQFKSRNMVMSWGDPIYLIREEANQYRFKAKRGVFSPDLSYYLNALNIRMIKDLLTV